MSAVATLKKTILVAEDEPSLLSIIAKRVQDAGYHVITAVDGEDAIQKSAKHAPDAALVDIIMPRKNGFDVIEKLKRDSPTLPVIVITNLESQQDQETGRRLGVNHYILKSNTSMRDLQRRLAGLFE